jgi:hypothetical protein
MQEEDEDEENEDEEEELKSIEEIIETHFDYPKKVQNSNPSLEISDNNATITLEQNLQDLPSQPTPENQPQYSSSNYYSSQDYSENIYPEQIKSSSSPFLAETTLGTSNLTNSLPRFPSQNNSSISTYPEQIKEKKYESSFEQDSEKAKKARRF